MIPLGWQTDLAVLRLSGSDVLDRGDHLLVRTPANPSYHWGNFVFALTDVDDAARWLAVFEEAFPEAAHRAIGLAAAPSDEAAWNALRLTIEHDDVLAADRPPALRPLPGGYAVRQLGSGADWAASTALRLAESPADERDFIEATTRCRAVMTEQGSTAWFGAFTRGGELAAELGIVYCGDGLARYQSVLTDAPHRRRGLTSHLLGVAASWAADRGARQWVIIAEEGSAPSRLYQANGFAPVESNAQAYRKP